MGEANRRMDHIELKCERPGSCHIPSRSNHNGNRSTIMAEFQANSALRSNQDALNRIFSRCRRNQETGCLEWQGAIGNGGYGNIGFRGKSWNVHRLVWSLVNGLAEADAVVMHGCDNRRCCEPSHLFLGSQRDNMQDASGKGRTKSGPKLHPECVQSGEQHWTHRMPDRTLKGERNGAAKLTGEDVRKIREMKSSGILQRRIAEQFGISESVVSLIVRGKAWV